MLDMFPAALAAEQTLRLFEDKCHVGLFLWRVERQTIEWSSGLFVLLGVREGSVQPTISLFLSLMHPEDRISASELNAMTADALPFLRKTRIIRADGRTKLVNIHGEFLLDASGRAEQMVGVVTDVTHQASEAQSLQGRHSRLSSIVRSVAPVVWAAAPDGTVSEHSGFAEVTGRNDRDGLGDKWIDALHEDDRAAALSLWRASIRKGQPFEQTFRFAAAGGRDRLVRYHAVPSMAPDRTVIGWRGLGVEVTADPSQETRPVRRLPSGTQIRAARGILNWSVSRLCAASGVSSAVVRRLEEVDSVSEKSAVPLEAIRDALEAAGVDFIFSHAASWGVRPASPPATSAEVPRAVPDL